MSFFLSALVLLGLIILFLFLGMGLVLVLGLVLLIAGIFAALNFLFMGGGPQGMDIPQRFNECLLEEPADDCLEDWTSWDKSQIESVKALAQQVKTELGGRGQAQTKEYIAETSDSRQMIRMELITDYEKKKAVHEHYVLIKKGGGLRIEELKWDYQ